MIYDNIVELCKEKNLTISELEKRANLGNGAVSKWKKSNPKVTTLQNVAKVLDKPIEYFLSE